MSRASAPTQRAIRADESYQTAGACIGELAPGMSLFALTRGQWSMIDAILWCLRQTGPARLSIWTWTIADYEIQAFTALRSSGGIREGRMVIDHGARNKNAALIAGWKEQFGSESVRYVVNHAKIATIEGGGLKLLLRGSMNLNFNPRFEQFDLSEGGPAFDLVREVEDELPILGDDAPGAAAYAASRLGEAFEPEQLAIFQKVKTWAK